MCIKSGARWRSCGDAVISDIRKASEKYERPSWKERQRSMRSRFSVFIPFVAAWSPSWSCSGDHTVIMKPRWYFAILDLERRRGNQRELWCVKIFHKLKVLLLVVYGFLNETSAQHWNVFVFVRRSLFFRLFFPPAQNSQNGNFEQGNSFCSVAPPDISDLYWFPKISSRACWRSSARADAVLRSKI